MSVWCVEPRQDPCLFEVNGTKTSHSSSPSSWPKEGKVSAKWAPSVTSSCDWSVCLLEPTQHRSVTLGPGWGRCSSKRSRSPSKPSLLSVIVFDVFTSASCRSGNSLRLDFDGSYDIRRSYSGSLDSDHVSGTHFCIKHKSSWVVEVLRRGLGTLGAARVVLTEGSWKSRKSQVERMTTVNKSHRVSSWNSLL